jgi:hypothetical protein
MNQTAAVVVVVGEEGHGISSAAIPLNSVKADNVDDDTWLQDTFLGGEARWPW